MTSRTRMWTLTACALATLLTAGIAAQAGAQAPDTATRAQGPTGPGGAGMMAMRQKMMADMAASEKKLDALVAKMNTAKGADKVEQVAAVLNELVAQHKAMHTRMASMEGGMMPGGMMRGGGASAPAAPAVPAPPDAGHEQHHE